MSNVRSSITSWPRRLVAAAVLLGAAACARQAPPPGGPVDDIPPVLAAVSPGSLAVRVDVDAPLVFTFSEKLDRRSFRSSLQLAPEIRIKDPSFKGERVIVRPESGWPQDTLVVWTLLPALKDQHGVKLGQPLSGAFTTGDTIPQGWIHGQVKGVDLEFSKVMVELRLPPEEGKRLGVLWRMGSANELGFFRVGPLAVPSGPFKLKAYVDGNGNGKRDEHEAMAELDSLRLGAGTGVLEVGELELIDLEAPVPLVICFDRKVQAQADSVATAVEASGETDSLAAGSRRAAVVMVSLRPIGVEKAKVQSVKSDSSDCVRTRLAPGKWKIGAWVDLDHDGFFGPTDGGRCEPFTAERELTMEPASPESLQWPWPTQILQWSQVDTMRSPPLPPEAFIGDEETVP